MTSKASKRQARRANRRVVRDLTDRIDLQALRAARERATLDAQPMRGMPTDERERTAWGLGED